MDYKEKYNTALEMAREAFYSPETPHFAKAWLLTLFPTIAENENKDERIKREILELVSIVGDGNQFEEIKDWLKKQGEQDSPVDVNKMVNEFAHSEVKGYGVPSMIEVDAYRKGIEDALENQGEQKPYGQRKECEDCQSNYAGECKGFCQMKRDEQKPADKIEPKFNIGDTMRTWREAANGYTDGMPVVVSIDNEYYHCTNELIAIKDQDDYEFPPINVKKNPADNVEPKFHPGDWIIDNEYGEVLKVTKADANSYEITSQDGEVFNILKEDVECNHRIWTIQDAEDGDVLVDVYGNIGIFDKCYDFDWMSSCSLGNNGGFQYFTVEHENEKTYPATKEQIELLFQKMKEAGWEWDAEKKEANKIEHKMLDADKVIKWLNDQACQGWIEDVEVDKFIAKFKKDFEL